MRFADPSTQVVCREDIPLHANQIMICGLKSGKLVLIYSLRDRASTKTSERPSWLDMHLTQSSITTVGIEVTIEQYANSLRSGRGYGQYTQKVIQATVRDCGGVTFGLLREVADRMMAQPVDTHNARSFLVRICFMADKATFPI